MSKIAITWYATASLKIESVHTQLLLDPFYPLVGAENRLDEDTFLHTNAILLSHGHLDYLSSLPKILKANTQAKVYATKTPMHTLVKKGCSKQQLRKIWPNEHLQIGDFNTPRNPQFIPPLIEVGDFLLTRVKKSSSTRFFLLKKENKVSERILLFCKNQGIQPAFSSQLFQAFDRTNFFMVVIVGMKKIRL